jgi:hypothetical protein
LSGVNRLDSDIILKLRAESNSQFKSQQNQHKHNMNREKNVLILWTLRWRFCKECGEICWSMRWELCDERSGESNDF